MRRAEQVTFGGSGLDRAALLRTDADRLTALMGSDAADVVALWRGKPLVAGPDRRLVRLRRDMPLVRDHTDTWCFLGREDDRAVFAADVSGWEPDQVEATVGAFVDPSEQRHPDLPGDHVFAEVRAIMAALGRRDAELAVTAKAVLGWHATHRFCANCGTESQTTQGGWQRDCPACGARHFPRTDPVVIMLITHGNDTLIGRSPGWPEGMYSLLAGFVEPGETIEAAVRREVVEEAGIDVGRVTYLASQPWPFPASLMIGCRGEALTREITIDPAEIEDARWVPREEMLLAYDGRHPDLKPARKGSIAHFIIGHWLADRLD